MLDVRICECAGDMRKFFALSDKDYLPEECRYLKRYVNGLINPLYHNGRMAFLIAVRDGKAVFRVLTGTDEVYKRLSGKKMGYFALFDGEEDEAAATALLKKAYQLQQSWGNEYLLGPVSPDGGGFFNGLSASDVGMNRGVMTGPGSRWKLELLSKQGFQPHEKEMAYKVEIPDGNPYLQPALQAQKRFSVEIEAIRTGIFREKWMRDISYVYAPERRNDTYMMLDKLKPVIIKRHSFIAYTSGTPAGFMLSLKGSNGLIRATTVFTSRDQFSPPVTLGIIAVFIESCHRFGIKTIEASVIDSRNFASNRQIRALGGRQDREYIRFIRKLL